MNRRWILIVVAMLVAVSAFADSKFGKQVRYLGIHPIPKSQGGGICYIEGPHVHIYAANKVEFRDHRGDHVFVGDPVAYGFDGPRYAYKGPHPIHVDAVVGGEPDVEYCYLTGPHFHNFAPPDGPEFKMEGNAYFYVAEPPRAFIDARPAYIGINEYYRPFTYERPRVEVDAPVGWIGARAELVGPEVYVEGRHGRAFVEPGVGVDVHVPMPSIQVGIGVDVGGPVSVHDRPVIIEERHHHDNGRHDGWHKGRE
jgi:hypothetical protein